MIFRQISVGSADYRAEWELREAVLRKPLGLSLADEDPASERDHLHFGLFEETGRLMGCIIAALAKGGEIRLRQMAVAPDFAGQGHGARILRHVEAELRFRGCQRVILHARKGVAGFYEKSGYTVTGPEFQEVGIAHLPMAKCLCALS